MQSVSSISSKLLFAAVPMIAVSAIAVLPGQAATFSASEAFVNLDEFSHTPENTDTQTDTQTLAVLGKVLAVAEADAKFSSASPVQATNETLSTVQGSGNFYQGKADSFAGVSGLFKVNKRETFSFNFLALLGLNASVDDPQSEKASALGKISFGLFDNQTNHLLDSFSILGQLSSDKTFNSINSLASSNHWNFQTNQFVENDGNSASFVSEITGQYSRNFDSDIEIRLEEVKQNSAEATAIPEPGLGAGLVGLFAFFWIRKQSNANKEVALSAPSRSLK
jgi:hypothetical protein